MNRGDRLVFSNGVLGLALGAIIVIVAFDADLNRLIQLYVVGVFTSFTLSQTGMVRHWLAERHKGRRRREGLAVLDRDQRDRRRHDRRRARRHHRHEVRGRRVALDPRDGDDRSRLPVGPPPLPVGAAAAPPRRGRAGTLRARTGSCCWCPSLSAATAEALGYVRSVRPPELHAVYIGPDPVTPDLLERWRTFAAATLRLERAGDAGPATCSSRVRSYLAGIRRAPEDFLTVVAARDRARGHRRLPAPAAAAGPAEVGPASRGQRGGGRRARVARGPRGRRRRRAAADPAANGDARVRVGRARRHGPGRELRAGARRHRDAGRALRPRPRHLAPDRGGVVRPPPGHPARCRRGAVPRPHRPDAGRGPPVHREVRHARDGRAARVRRAEVALPDPAQPERAVREAAVPVRGPRRCCRACRSCCTTSCRRPRSRRPPATTSP